MFKIFISYSQKNKEIAGDLKRYFEEYDQISCFIAHDDIAPGSQWEQEILDNLETSNFFMPLQTEHLIKSLYCQQEAGIALARKIKIVPLIPDVEGVDPVGFYSKYQGFKIKINDLRESVRLWLIKEGIIEAKDYEELEKRMMIFEMSGSFAEAGENARSLFELESQFTKAEVLRIIEATLKNNQILDSYAANGYLRPFFIKHASIISKKQMEEFLKH